jgi:hypothetical protein
VEDIVIDAVRLRQLIYAATPGPLKINRYDNVSDINYQLQTTRGGINEHEDYAVVANIRDDECPRAKPTAELIRELYNHAEEVADLVSYSAEQRKAGALALLDLIESSYAWDRVDVKRRM